MEELLREEQLFAHEAAIAGPCLYNDTKREVYASSSNTMPCYIYTC